MSRYFFRLDDVAPNMNWPNFLALKDIFEKSGVRPLMAVIPDVEDPELKKWPADENFWNLAGELVREGWILGQHGYQHIYGSGNGGILKINQRGEFAGIDFETQKTMIAKGRQILREKIGEPKVFVAPAHSFDRNTVKALKAGGFSEISDGIALFPFKKWDMVWLPQVLWRPKKMPLGLITIAIHPNTISEKEIENLGKFIVNNRERIGNFSELVNWYGRKNSAARLLIFIADRVFRIVWRIVFNLKFRA